MRFQKQYKDSGVWQEVHRGLLPSFLANHYENPHALIKELEESAHANAPWPSHIIQTPWAIYRALAAPPKPCPKPPPDWSTTVKIAMEDVLKWELYKEKVSSAIVDAAGLAANVPQKYEECWMAINIDTAGDHFIVHLGAWDADIAP